MLFIHSALLFCSFRFQIYSDIVLFLLICVISTNSVKFSVFILERPILFVLLGFIPEFFESPFFLMFFIYFFQLCCLFFLSFHLVEFLSDLSKQFQLLSQLLYLSIYSHLPTRFCISFLSPLEDAYFIIN